MGDSNLRARLPHGLSDVFFEQAALKEKLEAAAGHVFAQWGYGRIYVPTFEYYDSLTTEASARTRSEMYRFFDRDGHVMALRPDMTVATARVAGTKLYDQPLPLRFYYIGNVFRHVAPQAGRQHEFTQAGIELLGVSTPEADAEVVSVTVATLVAMGLTDFQINLGQVAFLKGLLDNTSISTEDIVSLEDAIERKNPVEINQTISRLGLDQSTENAIRAIPSLCGRDGVLDSARKLATTRASQEAIERLVQVYKLLQDAGMGDHVILDLGEARSMGYYTGTTYHVYAAGLGFPICSGGRYDNLVAHYGKIMPAMGFALGIERVMLLMDEPEPLGPDVLFATGGYAECYPLITAMRQSGLIVEQEISGRTGQELTNYACQSHARRWITCQAGSKFIVHIGDDTKTYSPTELAEEIAIWARS